MPEHLRQFTEQLAVWTEAIIEFGRTPFRRVETYPQIATELGIVEPPLVFWINRQSLMAGGILLVPAGDLQAELERGRSCALALGLRHFVTWEATQVRIWQIVGDSIKEERKLPLQAPDQPDTFRYLLEELLDALKLLAVLGAIPAQELSPHYFNNLFLITMQQTAGPLLQEYRRLRSETEGQLNNLDEHAQEANRLLLLKILSALLFSRLPETIHPESLEQSVNSALVQLSAPLQEAFTCKILPEEPALPLESAVAFHHLLLRLGQLSWQQPLQRAETSLHELIKGWYGDLSNIPPASVYIYPALPPIGTIAQLVLSDSPVLLAAQAMLAKLAGGMGPRLVCGQLLDLNSTLLPDQKIYARLLNNNPITGPQRQEHIIALRKSWPSRRFKLNTGQAHWMWEFIHLLGICPPHGELELEIPKVCLKTPADDVIWSILAEHFQFRRIEKLDETNILLNLQKSAGNEESFEIILPDETRVITDPGDPPQLRNRILLSLALPADIFSLLGNELPWVMEEGMTEDQPGWDIYSRSKLYRLLTEVLCLRKKSTKRNLGITQSECRDIPGPDVLQLKELETLAKIHSRERKQPSADHLLAELFSCPAVAEIALPQRIHASPSAATDAMIMADLHDTIYEQLVIHGIPNFPEQYLYFLEEPELQRYSFTPPLAVKDRLLGQFILEDASGRVVEGYGEELEQALLICAEIGKDTVELPQDRHQLTKLLSYYKKDLKGLYKVLSQLCYSRIEESLLARKLIKKLWQKMHLPAPTWFKN